MAFCPHCNIRYDEDNETQPCCGGCGHPITCGCSGHSHSPSTSTSRLPSSVRNRLLNRSDDTHDDDTPDADRDDDGDDAPDDVFEPGDDLPF